MHSKYRKVKSPTREIGGQSFVRIPVKTHCIMPGEDITAVTHRYCKNILQPGDIVVITQRALSVSQGRTVPKTEITPRPLAKSLASVLPGPQKGKERSQEYVELAMREVGAPRVVLATLAQLLTAWAGRRNDFEKVAGERVAQIKAPRDGVIPTTEQQYILPPVEPEKVVEHASRRLGAQVSVISADECGHALVIAHTSGVDSKLMEQLLLDNPLGQGMELTPIAIIRKVDSQAYSAAER